MRWRAIVVVVALGAAFAPLPRAGVERAYSTTFYLAIQPPVTGFSNAVPFALLDAMLFGVFGAWVGLTAIDAARRSRPTWRRIVTRLVVRSAVGAAALYLAFLVMWGFNYRRVPLAEKLQFDPAGVSAEGTRSLAMTTVDRVNALYSQAHAEGWPPAGTIDRELADAFARTQRALGSSRSARPARPKRSLLDVYFRRAAVSGMTDPYFLETLVSSGLLPFERPFVVAHEWSHLAGYADEGAANFVGWLTCLHGTDANRYSGWLFLYGELAGAVGAGERREMRSRLASGPRADLQAVAERIQRQVSPALSTAGWRVYDRYLKANRVETGAKSYAEVVRLVLGVRFAAEGTPLLK